MHKAFVTISKITVARILSGVVLLWINQALPNATDHAVPTAVAPAAEINTNLELSVKLSIKMH
ncbi:hypothetical protein [Pseudomonas sp. SK2]|uniref:hypothetical protein n=1 Tax=Pseudomonas sp. SK2 TaxID=2841063 RepID=UPI00192A730D|nr:hypothetical protein [Pseudomonas sp. SK2]QQZ36360.1 hypothetical protein IF103_00045 [Pseudomonas sp. SK2]